MLLYLLLDTTSTVAYWLIKNLGFGLYYIISYLYNGGNLSKEDKEKKDTLEMLIKQNEDIEIIKAYIKKIEEEKKNNKNEEKTDEIEMEELKLVKDSVIEEIKNRNINQENSEEIEDIEEKDEDIKVNNDTKESVNVENKEENTSNKKMTNI